MKAILLILSGFFVTTSSFAGGAVYAVSLLSVDRVSDPQLDMNRNGAWTSHVTTVTAESDRVGSTPVATGSLDKRVTSEARSPTSLTEAVALEGTVTASLELDMQTNSDDAQTFSPAHIDWCADRYRSYDANTNSYRSYSGHERPCRSPFISAGDEDIETVQSVGKGGEFQEASLIQVGLMDDHANACAARYQSYRVSDNTYQPLGGGPRRECR